MGKVDLGFLEAPKQPWLLKRNFFPSKVGGKPAWLDPLHLPPATSLQCPTCNKQMVFLLQVYAPNEDRDNAFHRTVFVFCCKNNGCYKLNDNNPVKAFRCNLPRRNEFYGFDPPDYDACEPPQTTSNEDFSASLCEVCGCLGKKVCSRCKSVHYCVKEHQVLDWKKHKRFCQSDTTVSDTADDNTKNSFLFQEKEIIIEPEELTESQSDINGKEVATEEDIQTTIYNEEELNSLIDMKKEDKVFLKFKERISIDPEQVIRYEKNGNPLWCSREFVPKPADIPCCRCGSERIFEFQIMPRVLSYMNVDSLIQGPTIDWGTIAIYTCSSDCSVIQSSDTASYNSEIAWKQNIS